MRKPTNHDDEQLKNAQHPRFGTPEFERLYERYEQGKIIGILMVGAAMVLWIVGFVSDVKAGQHNPSALLYLAGGVSLVGLGVCVWAGARRARLFRQLER